MASPSSQAALTELIHHTLPQLNPGQAQHRQRSSQAQLDAHTRATGGSTRSSYKDWSTLADEAQLALKRAGRSSQERLQFAQLSARLHSRVSPARFDTVMTRIYNDIHMQSYTFSQAVPRNKLDTLSLLLSLAGSSSIPPTASSSAAAATLSSSSTGTTSRQAPLFGYPTPLDRPASRPSSRAANHDSNSRRGAPVGVGLSSSSNPNLAAAALPRAPKLSMAAVLASHRAQLAASRPIATTTPPRLAPVPESLLLRDILYIIQGIDGRFIRFKTPTPSLANAGPRRTFKRGEIVVDENSPADPEALMLEQGIEFVLEGSGYSLSAPMRVLLHTLSELGWLYRKIDGVLQRSGSVTTTSSAKGAVFVELGMIEQSLHAALKAEMTEYYRLVAILESQLTIEDESTRTQGGADMSIEDMEGKLTLRRLMVWTEEVKLRMRMMGTLVEEAGGENVGGALLTSLHARTSNGDPFIRDFSSRLLRTLSVPFFATLSAWIYEGELRDPFGEFFVQLNPALSGVDERTGLLRGRSTFGLNLDQDDEGVQAHQLWEGKFRFKRVMLPGFLEESFGRKIFSTGRSLNFMKYSCGDGQWVASTHQTDGQRRALEYADIIGLEQSITAAYSHTSKRLFDIFFDKFRLMDHLKALKDYLMLGKGDFVEILMENLGPSLDRPANLLYRHNLTATLETALRGSSSGPSSLTSSSANRSSSDVLRRLDARMLEFTQGEIGWDVFTLEYKVDAPLDTILDPESMQGYLKMFKHLWHIKRVEYALNGVQRRLMTGARTFLKVPELSYDFHLTRIALQRMTFFIRQLQYYCHLEVIACSWQVLEEFALKKQGDLDSLIEAHRVYLRRLVTKALLIQPRSSHRTEEERYVVLEGVRNLFQMMLQYQNVADALCNYALSEASRQQASNPTLAARSADTLDGIRHRLQDYATQFDSGAKEVVRLLGKAKDLDMRFLAVRLNFNYKFTS
ncbi:BZ3500_MvSof-1268-A1-R1_Chr9g10326 [Microbotryum saponariae]|uniref:BZ3500_MvSof-1268-A1-R1_Chr9g10326 protein n=1 Tax=Microbotryum saponariae TaxID=289078 RepID=A0A2X0MDD8_9BASI|nr:BZ3501_MvSof-1269-A2-R1_Chr9g10076 [Microbotryum saponariae]SCZ99906.1 BZ3500_MvSof-1268-A1-R1_Chr9g10326 [Microbotryum saponariae]